MDSLERNNLMQTYQWEAEGYLKTLNEGIVQLEKNPENTALIGELFRAAHTLKGASRMMEIKPICELAHQIEEILAQLRDQNLSFSPVLVDEVLAAIDFSRGIINAAVFNEQGLPSAEALCRRLIELREKGAGAPESVQEEEETIPGNADTGFNFQHFLSAADEHIRVPLTQVDQLFNLTGGIVLNKVKSMYRSNLSHRSLLFKNLSLQIGFTEERLRALERNIEELAYFFLEKQAKAPSGVAPKAPLQALELIQELQHLEEILARSKNEIIRFSQELQLESFRLSSVIEELQQKMKEIRMVPCTLLFAGFSRLVRDVARAQQKSVELQVSGQETQLDKKILEGIKASLIHLILNAVVHGVESKEARRLAGKKETATIVLAASQEGAKILITVSDDGGGIALEKIRHSAVSQGWASAEEAPALSKGQLLNLLFEENFSTSTIATDYSGRGVGLNVVRTELRRLKGKVTIETEAGKGTVFRIELPPTLAILRVLFFTAGGLRYALPMESVLRSLKVATEDFVFLENQRNLYLEDRWMPVFFFHEFLNLSTSPYSIAKTHRASEGKTMIVLSEGGKEFGLLVDRILGEEEVFVKPLDAYLEKVGGVLGATSMSDGEVVLILNLEELMPQPGKIEAPVIAPETASKKILIVDHSLSSRELEKSILEDQGYSVELACDGVDALEKLDQEKDAFWAVVSDIEMPRMNGLQLLEEMKRKPDLATIPVILISARREEIERGMNLGASGYILKNQFNEKKLLFLLEQLA